MGTLRTAQDIPPETLQALLSIAVILVAMFNICSLNLFVARVDKNSRWPLSMPEYLRSYAFEYIADLEFEFDVEIGLNIIFFYNSLYNEKFVGHENEWVTVKNQKVIEYGQEYTDDKLNEILEIMPGAIQFPVDQKRLPYSNNQRI
ncbi:hypothetical protein Glove_609g7 [Diversispora epigaea]|uniref:Uncharacterized protein n=1 Tax=Diversispora epigaea TaxID=1348612 RepID=A0A397G6I8_9GLOM|nr:hypothetical protein Glove_609g7 [Diversispora epigaea]